LSRASAKKVQDAARLRYIRVLERFTSSITKYLFKAEEPTREQFDKKVDNNRKYLDRVEKIALYKGDYNDLESLVKKILSYRESDADIETVKEEILYTANQIEKSMNRRRYKKDKHTSDKFKDWE
jgi:endonuclease III